jgi:tetratricopeptide (TPR) repeat protein
MNFWDWLFACRAEYQRAGDENRVRLTEYWQRAFPYRETDPDQAVALLQEGCLLAEELGERWWIIALNNWRVAALIHFKRDYRQAVELAVRNAVAVSKPENAAFPGRWGVYRELVSAYLGVDPVGFADVIQEALTQLDRDLPSGPHPDRYLWLGSLRQFHQECGDFEAAEAAATRAMELSADDPYPHHAQHSMVYHYSGLCWMAYRQEDWQKLATWAEIGEEAARATGNHQLELCEFLAWQAILARRDGDELRARRFHTLAAAKMSRLHSPPEREYPDALALFHELNGELERALQVRDWEWSVIENHGRVACECEIHLKRAALLMKMGRLQRERIDAARQAALKLRKPEKLLAKIDQLATTGSEEVR